AAGRVADLAGVMHRPGGVRVASPGHTEILAVCLTEDGAAGVENAGDDGRVDLGHIALEGGRPVHHRHAGEHHVVLEDHGLALELALARSLDSRLVVPGVMRVLLRSGTMAGRSWVLH